MILFFCDTNDCGLNKYSHIQYKTLQDCDSREEGKKNPLQNNCFMLD
jgi:hypothetical protein